MKFPDNFLHDLSTSVGQLVVHWSFVEQGLDQWIAIIFHGAGGNTLQADLPRAYIRKTRFLRKCFKALPALAEFAEDGTSLLDRANALVEKRHTVIHGVLSEFDDETKTVTLVKLDARGAMHHQERETLTFLEMLSAGDKCLQLSTDIIAFTQRLLKAFMPEDRLKKAFGNL